MALKWFGAVSTRIALCRFVTNTGDASSGTLDEASVQTVDNLRNLAFGTTDGSLRKNFPIREKLTMQFPFDVFNFLNHPNWGERPPTRPLDRSAPLPANPTTTANCSWRSR